MGWRSSVPAPTTEGARRGNTGICARPRPQPPARRGSGSRAGGEGARRHPEGQLPGSGNSGGRGPDQPGLGTQQGRSRGCWLRGGSALRSGFLLSATVLTRFLGPPSAIYLTSQFSLSGRQGGVEAGRAEAGGDGEPKGEPLLPSAQTVAVSLPRGVPSCPPHPRPWRSANPLVHSHRFGNEETREESLVQGPRVSPGGARLPVSRVPHSLSIKCAPRPHGARGVDRPDFHGKPQVTGPGISPL